MSIADLNDLAMRTVIREELDRSPMGSRVRQLQADAQVATALPTAPLAGQEVYLQTAAMAALTVPLKWLLRFDGSKWLPVSCPPLIAEVATSETTANTTYAALATAGPVVTVPVLGDYDVEIGATMVNATNNPFMSYDIGGTGAVDADSFIGGTGFAAGNRVRRKAAIPASTALTAKYRNNGATTGTFRERWMRVSPVRLG